MTKTPAQMWTEMAAEAVRGLLSPYNGRLQTLPASANSDPYVLGFVNSVLLSVIDQCIGDDGPYEFREDLLVRAQKLLEPPLAHALVNYSPGLSAFFDEGYLKGLEEGELCADVINGKLPVPEPPLLQSARDLADAKGSPGRQSLSEIGGALVTLTLHQRVREIRRHHSPNVDKPLSRPELVQAREQGIRDAELGAALNLKHRKARLVGERRQSHKVLVLPSILLLIGLVAIFGLLVERNF